MTKKDQKAIRELFCDERECGHSVCDFDDYEHDLKEIADYLEIELDYNEEEEEECLLPGKKRDRAEEALNYYYELHGC